MSRQSPLFKVVLVSSNFQMEKEGYFKEHDENDDMKLS